MLEASSNAELPVNFINTFTCKLLSSDVLTDGYLINNHRFNGYAATSEKLCTPNVEKTCLTAKYHYCENETAKIISPSDLQYNAQYLPIGDRLRGDHV